LAFTTSLLAQTNKGKVLLGLTTGLTGNVSTDIITGKPSSSAGFSFGTFKEAGDDEGEKYAQFNFSPAIGFCLSDNFLAGIEMGFLSETYKYGDDKETLQIFGAGPLLRYYLAKGKVKPLLELRANFGSLAYKYNGEKDEEPTKFSKFGGGAGAAIFLNDHISFDILASFNAHTIKNTDDDKTKLNLFGLNLGFSFFL
jgi:hypothetical protein